MLRIGAGRRYAEAAFELATRDGTVDAWQRDLAFAAGWPATSGLNPGPWTAPPVAFEHRPQGGRGNCLAATFSPQALKPRPAPYETGPLRESCRRSAPSTMPWSASPRGIVAATVTTPGSALRRGADGGADSRGAARGSKVELGTDNRFRLSWAGSRVRIRRSTKSMPAFAAASSGSAGGWSRERARHRPVERPLRAPGDAPGPPGRTENAWPSDRTRCQHQSRTRSRLRSGRRVAQRRHRGRGSATASPQIYGPLRAPFRPRLLEVPGLGQWGMAAQLEEETVGRGHLGRPDRNQGRRHRQDDGARGEVPGRSGPYRPPCRPAGPARWTTRARSPPRGPAPSGAHRPRRHQPASRFDTPVQTGIKRRSTPLIPDPGAASAS